MDDDEDEKKIEMAQDDRAFEKTKLALELKLEKRKLRSEVRRAILTALTVLVPVAGVIATAVVGVGIARQQAKDQLRLEVAKAVMSAPTIAEAHDRRRMFKEIIPDIDVAIVGRVPENRVDAWVVPMQREFFRTMAASRDLKPPQILALYKAIFPHEDEWIHRETITEVVDSSQQKK